MDNTLVANPKSKLNEWGYGDQSLVDSVVLFQANHSSPLQDLCQQYHGRNLNVDGDIGPATAHIMNTRFCDCPDLMPGTVAEEANWPVACRNDITVSWNFNSVPGLTTEQTTSIWESVKEEYERLFEMGVILKKGDYPNTRIYAALRALLGPTLAWSYLATNNCRDRLQQAIDNTIRWSFNLAKGTFKHECGHAFGMYHTPNDSRSLMYPSMNGQIELNGTDISQMISLGYKRRTTPPPLDWGMF